MPPGKRRRLALIAAFGASLTAAAGPTPAARCEQPCKAETAACMRARCRGLAGQTRRSCVETCRGIGGCAPIRTLAWVETEVRTDAAGLRQALRVRRGNCMPVTVMEFASPANPDPAYVQVRNVYGTSRFGHASVVEAFVQRLSVATDGSGVVFEITDDAAVLGFFRSPAGIEEGFYFVRADGTGLRRLGPQSGVRRFSLYPDASFPGGFAPTGFVVPASDISPNGRLFVFTDRGPGPTGEPAVQIVTLDIATGRRTVVTRLPEVEDSPFNDPDPGYPRFIDNDTILFSSAVNPDSMNPERDFTGFIVHTDGTGLRRIARPVGSPGAQVVASFVVTGVGTNLVNLVTVPGSHGVYQEKEIFLIGRIGSFS